MPFSTDDRFQNVLTAQVLASAANVLTFAEVQTGASLGLGLGLVIDTMDFWPNNTSLAEMTAANDRIVMAWCTSDQVDDLEDPSDSRIIHAMSYARRDAGTAANALFQLTPFHHEFTPPRIVAIPRVYLATISAGLASANRVFARLGFRYIKLTDKEYLELAETFLLG